MVGRIELVNRIVSESTSIPLDEVSAINKFFFKELENELKECKRPFIFVRGLGTFALNKKMIESRIRYLISVVKKNREDGLAGVYNPKRDHYIKWTRLEIYNLLKIRRVIRDAWRLNLKLKTCGKDNVNSQG